MRRHLFERFSAFSPSPPSVSNQLSRRNYSPVRVGFRFVMSPFKN